MIVNRSARGVRVGAGTVARRFCGAAPKRAREPAPQLFSPALLLLFEQSHYVVDRIILLVRSAFLIEDVLQHAGCDSLDVGGELRIRSRALDAEGNGHASDSCLHFEGKFVGGADSAIAG